MTRREWYTPKQLAESFGGDTGKVLAWIHTGQLEAVNVSESAAGRPRWRISQDAWERFQMVRSNRVTAAKPRAARRRRDTRIIEFF